MATLTQWELVGETKEWVGPITVTVDTVPVSSFEVALCEGTARPTTWAAADADPDGGGAKGILVGAGTSYPLTVGKKYMIFTRFTDSPEIPVQRAGIIKVT